MSGSELSKQRATRVIRSLQPQYANDLTSAVLEAALVVIDNELVVPAMQAALRLVRRREQDGHWRTHQNHPPQIVWHACIVLWRLQRTLEAQARRKRGG